jgi:iron complex transport system ATP-binding protein
LNVVNALEAIDLSIGYKTSRRTATTVARGLNVALRRGELVCLLGPNGAGKSTLMRTLAALQSPLAGRILLNGRETAKIPPRDLARELSVVLTDRVSVGMMDVYALVSLGRQPHTDWTGRLRERDHVIIRESLQAVGADVLATRQIAELSDGERQRVMVARALAQEPAVMVLDEITAFLDLPRRVDVMRLLRDLARRQRCAVLLSTHDLDLALRTADRVWLLGRDGVLRLGAPEELVLSGAFEHTFEGEGIVFDREQGAFLLASTPISEVSLRGDGVATAWTIRALERLGFRVRRGAVADTSGTAVTAHIDIIETEGVTEWELHAVSAHASPSSPLVSTRARHRSLSHLLHDLETHRTGARRNQEERDQEKEEEEETRARI